MSCLTEAGILADLLAATAPAVCGASPRGSIHQDEAEVVAGFVFLLQGLDDKAVVARRLEDIDPAGFHGGPCLVTAPTRIARDLATLPAQAARAGEEDEGLVISVLEEVLLHGYEKTKKTLKPLFPVRRRRRRDVNEDCASVRIQDLSGLVRRRRRRRAAMAVSETSATELALHPHPRRRHDARGMNDLHGGRPHLPYAAAIGCQAFPLHILFHRY